VVAPAAKAVARFVAKHVTLFRVTGLGGTDMRVLAFFGLLGLVAATQAACDDKANRTASAADTTRGQALYKDLCASCHGAKGEGGVAPVLRDWSRGEATLTRIIDERMPQGAPEKCDGDCPPSIARYILETFKGEVVCEAPKPLARGLRLLSRRELAATMTDLLAGGAAAPSPATAPCGTVSFVYDPKGRAVTRVHVAGSFNGWPGTVAGGGYPLARAGNVFSLAQRLPNGSHAYKLVLDERDWIPDPENARRGPDGFGGENSLVDVTCPAPGATPEKSDDALAAAFVSYPKEARPEAYPFDQHGPSRVMSAPLAEAVFRIAATVSQAADMPKMLACGANVDEACARAFVERVGKRVFRRPLEADEQKRYEALALGGTDRTKGARLALRAMLTSPAFLYRTELGEKRGETFVLTRWEIASAMAYGVTGSMPDDALLAAAERGDLTTREGREREARRLLGTARARTHLGELGEQWLGADKVTEMEKQSALFPDDSPALRAAMREETRRFFSHVVFDGTHRAAELFRANYTFVDATLAKHYGMPAPKTPFEKQTYPDRQRAGLLGHASVLATTAHSDQSSPIRRGLFVRRNLLCQELPPPPPNVGGVPKIDPTATTRERFAQHTANAFCASCHRHIDPVGFGFERFDAMGRLREIENGKPIDAKGDMTDVEGLGKGTSAPFADLTALGETLAESRAAEACVARQLYRFTRGVLESDACVTRPYEARLRERGGDLRELMVDLVSSDDFTVRQ